MASLSMKELLEAGVHFGHQTRRWNPKMKRYIYGARNGIYIIDLHQTLKLFEEAQRFVQEVVANGGNVLFVGTKKQAQEAVVEAANRCRQYYVNQRWLGGMLTNYKTIQIRIKRLEELHQLEANGTLDKLTKKEATGLLEERGKLERYLGGIKTMPKLPEVIFIVDLKKEHIALAEARKLDIPVVAIVDTNCDPDNVDFVVPGNDDAIRAIKLISNKIADAIIEVKQPEWDLQAERAAAGYVEPEKVAVDGESVVEDTDSIFLGDEEDEYAVMARLATAPAAAPTAAAEVDVDEVAAEPQVVAEVAVAAEPEVVAAVEVAGEPEVVAEAAVFAEPEVVAAVEVAAEPEVVAEAAVVAEPEVVAAVEVAAEPETAPQ